MRSLLLITFGCLINLTFFVGQSFAINLPKFEASAHNNHVLLVDLGQIPDWCLNFEIDERRIQACGVAESKNLSMARSRATMDAKRQIADQLNGVISSKMEEIVTSITNSSSEEMASKLEMVTETVVKRTKLSGYEVVKNQLLKGPKGFTYIVLINYPKVLVNEAIVEEVKSELKPKKSDDGLNSALFDLEKEIARQRLLQ